MSWLRVARAAALLTLLGVPASSGQAQDVPSPSPAPATQLERLGEAVAAHVRGRLEEAPSGTRWALRMRASEAPSSDGLSAGALHAALLRPTRDMLTEAGREPHLVAFSATGEAAPRVAARLGYPWMVDLTVTRRGGQLLLDGHLWRTDPASDLGRLTLRAPIDASLRAFLGFPPVLLAEAVSPVSGAMLGGAHLAMAVADLDADGRGELVTVGLEGVLVFSVEVTTHPRFGQRLRVRLRGRADWPSALARAPSRRRRPIATALPIDGAVIVRTSEHARSVRARLVSGQVTLEVEPESCDGYPVDAGCAALVDGRDFFDETLVSSDTPHVAAAHFYVHHRARFADREGHEADFEALVTPQGRLALRVQSDGEARPRSAGAVGYGTALAMTDLDLDGRPELLVSHAAPEGEPDQLTLLRALPRGALRVVWRSEPTAGSVWSAAAGDVDGDGQDELLAIEDAAPGASRRRARLWMVR